MRSGSDRGDAAGADGSDAGIPALMLVGSVGTMTALYFLMRA
jgi:hypothetical protein